MQRMGAKKKDEIVCFCLKITEKELIKAIQSHKIQSVDDVIKHTKAGDGCTACHPVIKKLLKPADYLDSSSPPICSAK